MVSRTFASYVFRGLIKPSVTNFYYFENEFHSSPSTFNHMKNMVYMAQAGYYRVRVGPQGVCYPSIKFEETRFESLGNITTTNIRQLWLNAPILQSLRELKTFMPESHFHAVDVRYLREFVNSP